MILLLVPSSCAIFYNSSFTHFKVKNYLEISNLLPVELRHVHGRGAVAAVKGNKQELRTDKEKGKFPDLEFRLLRCDISTCGALAALAT